MKYNIFLARYFSDFGGAVVIDAVAVIVAFGRKWVMNATAPEAFQAHRLKLP